jgi:hypothetical protein
LLTNFENPEKKLLQIILVGQRQLEAILKLHELAQVSQRIGLNCRLLPMNYPETKGYIERRLEVAGIISPLFTPQATRAIFARSQGIPRVINLICDLALLFGFIDEKYEIGRATITQVMKELNLYAPAKRLSRHPRHQRDTTGAHANGFKRPGRLALVAGIAVCSLLGIGVVLQSSLARRQLREYRTTGASPLAVVPHRPGVRAQPQPVQWAHTTLSYQLPTGEPLAVALPPLQPTPDQLPVKVTLDASDTMPLWLKFDPEQLALSGTAPLTETGKTYHLTVRARTAAGLESPLQLAVTLIPQTRPALAVPRTAPRQGKGAVTGSGTGPRRTRHQSVR